MNGRPPVLHQWGGSPHRHNHLCMGTITKEVHIPAWTQAKQDMAHNKPEGLTFRMGTTRRSIVGHSFGKGNTLILNLYTSVAKDCKRKGDTNVSIMQAKLSLPDLHVSNMAIVTLCQFRYVFQSHHPIASVSSYRIRFHEHTYMSEKNTCSTSIFGFWQDDDRRQFENCMNTSRFQKLLCSF